MRLEASTQRKDSVKYYVTIFMAAVLSAYAFVADFAKDDIDAGGGMLSIGFFII